MVTVYPVGASLVWGRGVAARMSKDLNPSTSRPQERWFSAGSVSPFCQDAAAPTWGRAGSGSEERARAPSQDLPMGLVSFHLPLHPWGQRKVPVFTVEVLSLLISVFGVLVEDKACKPNQCYRWKGLNNTVSCILPFKTELVPLSNANIPFSLSLAQLWPEETCFRWRQ